MNVALLCDDRPQSGLGHVMRCTAISHALRARGHQTFFAPEDKQVPACDLIVVDSYQPDEDDLASWSRVAPLAVIDDLADRNLGSARVVINQNFGAERLPYRAAHAQLLLGPRFAMLRDEFVLVREEVQHAFHADDKRVLVTLGGGEIASAMTRVVAALEGVERQLDVTILGIDGSAFQSRHRIRAIRRTDDVARLMRSHDLCITGGGVTTLELACVGTPAIVLTLAPNQEPGAAALRELGLAPYGGDLDGALPALGEWVGLMLDQWELRQRLRDRLMESVDGCGAERVATSLEAIARK